MTNSSAKVCVTGASGFIGSRIVADLLEAGYPVRGTVRDATRTDKYGFLVELPGAAECLELVSADLMEPDSFAAAVDGCTCVMHTASPYTLDVKDAQRDLVDPAVQGTLAVLRACAASASVTRVVVTSSMAAITDEPDESVVLTEADWNDKSSLSRNPYYFSKTMAERAAWDFMKSESPAFDLVVINPFMVIGPSLTPSLNTSNELFVALLKGGYPGVMRVAWGFVDVRDVSRAHILAMETSSASGRYICANETLHMRELVDMLKELGYSNSSNSSNSSASGYKLPKMSLDCSAGDLIVKFGSFFQSAGVRSYLKTHLGRVPRFDHGKVKDQLGLEFRPLRSTVSDAVEDLLRWQHVAPS